MVGLKHAWRIILILGTIGSWGLCAEVDDLYQRGLEAYRNGQWNLTIQEFSSLLQRGYESPVLYYNLGNAYFRADNVAGAVWAYSKALQLDPTDKDARYNLSLTNLKVKDRIEQPDIPFFIQIYRSIRGHFTPGSWVRLVSLLLLVLSAVYLAARFFSSRYLNGIVVAGTVLALLLSLISVDSIITTRKTMEGIVYSEVVDVYSAPSDRSVKLFELHEGLKVTILDHSNEWYQIELLDGKSGWTHETQLWPL